MLFKNSDFCGFSFTWKITRMSIQDLSRVGGRDSEITGGIVGPVVTGEDYITYCAACSRAHQTYDDC